MKVTNPKDYEGLSWTYREGLLSFTIAKKGQPTVKTDFGLEGTEKLIDDLMQARRAYRRELRA